MMARRRDDVPAETLDAVIQLGHGACAVCGRRCGRHEVWRHTMGGDDPAHFSLLCQDCRPLALARRVRPARYLFRFPAGQTPAWAIVCASWRIIMLMLGIATWTGFAVLCGSLIYIAAGGAKSTLGTFWVFGLMLATFKLFLIAVHVFNEITAGRLRAMQAWGSERVG